MEGELRIAKKHWYESQSEFEDHAKREVLERVSGDRKRLFESEVEYKERAEMVVLEQLSGEKNVPI